jgi:hypothetical protein
MAPAVVMVVLAAAAQAVAAQAVAAQAVAAQAVAAQAEVGTESPLLWYRKMTGCQGPTEQERVDPSNQPVNEQ